MDTTLSLRLLSVLKIEINMSRVYELYDALLGDHVSYHSTLRGALIAMSEKIRDITPALVRDMEDDKSLEITLTYSVKSYEVKP